MAARMREAGLDESGLGGLSGAIREAGPEAEQHLAEHDERVRMDERARLEGRQRDGSRPRPPDSPEQSRDPRPVTSQDETELLEQPPQTR
ncbi:MAG: hypothetical protein K0Q93_2519 [Nocardioidaceae bacterium]|nr:hypothetical protein [Nocardioidaceae bacterium]